MRTLQRRFALIRRYVLGVLLLVPLFFAQGAHTQAAIVKFDGTGATGIRNLPVDGVTYNIDYVFGPYVDIFPLEQLFPTAASIRDAIIIAMNAEGAPLISSVVTDDAGQVFREFFAIPVSFFDCPLGPICDDVGTEIGVRDGSIIDGSLVIAWEPVSGGTSPTNLQTWAIPTLVAVPLPAALPLFGSALAMLGIVGWRRRRQAGA